MAKIVILALLIEEAVHHQALATKEDHLLVTEAVVVTEVVAKTETEIAMIAVETVAAATEISVKAGR